MNYILKNEDLIFKGFSPFKSVVAINLPIVGEVPVKMAIGVNEVTVVKDQLIPKNFKCFFLRFKDSDEIIVTIVSGFFGVNICGSALVVLHDMGYNLTDKASIKKAKEDKDKVKAHYQKLIIEKPELFGDQKVNYSKFILKEDYFFKSSHQSFLVLPTVGLIKVKINDQSKIDFRECDIFKVRLKTQGFNLMSPDLSGDAIITMHYMGYDLNDKKSIVKALKEDVDKILNEYRKIIEEKPELFDENNIDMKLIDSKKSNGSKFTLKEDYFIKEYIQCFLVLPTIGLINVKINGQAKVSSDNCFIFKNKLETQLFEASFLGERLSGDAIITMHHMGYNLNDKKSMAKALKEDVDKILNEYKKIIDEKPELFDINQLKIKLIQDKRKEIEDSIKLEDSQSILEISLDEFNNKKTIIANKSIRHDMTDFAAGLFAAAKSYNNLLDGATAAYQFIELIPRYVETNKQAFLLIDLNYTGNDWVFFKNGSMVILADKKRLEFKPMESDTGVHSGGKVDENLYYEVPFKSFQSISEAKNIRIQISGKNSKVEFDLQGNDINILQAFFVGIFNGEDPLGNKSKFKEKKPNKPVKKTKKITPKVNKKSIDVKAELKKFKEMLDEGLIEKEDYDAKKKELLGL